ncbi:MAG: tRNA uridine-5-carboxymethylaminomethyl(34) synthesis enzyme MnmG [Rickettsia sp.]|nr:tRNA uridine-5-carboxymethylaminomethyl(34) synthesis enzyme MnmG [Rickettsia sp.]
MNHFYDVIVLGGGHAGCEAANISSQIGVNTLLITLEKNNIGAMSCNPSIGGVGKGILVKEIDALDGLMGLVIDQSAIHYKMLNKSKGPAVWGPRAQADRELYKKNMYNALLKCKNLDLLYDSVQDLKFKNSSIYSVITLKKGEIFCNKLIIATGTFLSSKIHIGLESFSSTKLGNFPCKNNISENLKSHNFHVKRFKTGTPPRIKASSICLSKLQIQKPDAEPQPFSELTNNVFCPQLDCYITHTNSKTHRIISDNIKLSSIYSGSIESSGPRYCPSIEDKIVRFSDRNSHQIFLEPEGLNSDIIYPSGISTSLPKSIQNDFIHSIIGLEESEITQYGYAIEYDYLDPKDLHFSLESKIMKNLYFAGQINGTTGYEEAAAQGLVAGINAANSVLKKDSLALTRANSYIGLMIDDLVTQGVVEPYRMFTSRSEYRLSLRPDNADLRLTPLSFQSGFLSEMRKNIFEKKKSQLNNIKSKLLTMFLTKNQIQKQDIKISQDGVSKNAFELLGISHIGLDSVLQLFPTLTKENKKILKYLEIESKYSYYLKRQEEEIKFIEKEAQQKIPENINYNEILSLSTEVKEKLKLHKPKTIYEAKKISGITPTSILALMIFLKIQSNIRNV